MSCDPKILINPLLSEWKYEADNSNEVSHFLPEKEIEREHDNN